MSVTRPVTQRVTQPVLRSVFDPVQGGGGGDPLLDAVLALYANGEQGALYYFTEDFAGLYQDALGTTPVTAVGQPVGLMLDRRFGLARGPELNPDVDIDNPDAWALGDGWSIVDGALVANLPTGNAIIPAVVSEVGKTYEITFEVVEHTSGSVRIGGGTGSGTVRSGTGVFSEIRTAVSSNSFRFLSAGSPVLKIGRFSIREIPGNHASQPTTTARPLLQRDGNGKLERRFDAVDDVMNTTFPALGSSVTIGRAIPGVGAQILTGQTINAGVWADNVSSNATAIIDRALTPDETATLTAWLNQQSGV